MQVLDSQIAAAARAFVSAQQRNCLYRTNQTDSDEAQALNKLSWMIDAERHDWSPDDYTPGC